jgi:hypothetical protein
MIRPSAAAALPLLVLLLPGVVAADERREDPRCAQHGRGFLYSETTGACIRISGSVESSYRFGSGRSVFDSEGSVSLDARKDTELGPLRLFVKPKMGVEP